MHLRADSCHWLWASYPCVVSTLAYRMADPSRPVVLSEATSTVALHSLLHKPIHAIICTSKYCVPLYGTTCIIDGW